jgi:NAD+ synthase
MNKIKKKPKLVFTNKPLRSVIRKLLGDESIIVADSFNYSKVNDLADTILVRNNDYEQIGKYAKHHYSKIIAIGGCSALDMGRALATDSDLIAIPTILSTDCISVDRSVLKGQDGKNRLLQTTAPSATIISFPSLLVAGPMLLGKWSSSGFGDLFANIGAALDAQFRESGNVSIEKVRTSIPEIFDALHFSAERFRGYDSNLLKRLALWCHNASLMIMKLNRRAGGEHKLYYSMKENEGYSNQRPTHGQIVAVGTLISARIAAERSGDFLLYKELQKAYKNLGLPIDYSGLEKVRVSKEKLVRGIEAMPGISLITDYFLDYGTSLLDAVFGNQTKKKKQLSFPEAGLKKALTQIKARHLGGYSALIEGLVTQIQEFWERSGKPKLIIGLSGGVDSSVVAYLAAKAVSSENVVALTLPAWEGDKCVELAGLIRDKLGIEKGGSASIESLVEELAFDVCELSGQTPSLGDISFGNIASRLRVNYLYAVANVVGGRVLGSGNRTEFVQGYATKYGTPNSCDFGVLDELYKTDVYELAKILRVPEEIIEQKPTTGFFQGQTHETELGATMDELDVAAFLLFERKLSVEEIVDQYHAPESFLKIFADRYSSSEHKRILRNHHVKLGFISD